MKEKKRKMRQDAYGWAQAQQRKNANLERRAELDVGRKAAWGSPVHGITTPFVESFDSGGQAEVSAKGPRAVAPAEDGTAPALPTSPHILNYLLSKDELAEAIEHARRVTEPVAGAAGAASDPAKDQEEAEAHAARHAKAVVALQRLTDLRNGSSKDRRHANIRRCIETFGRHVTDETVPNGAPPPSATNPPIPKPVRAGPDTGSSEVQIAILTAKIRALALELEGPTGHRDKNNKRSLRVLCHKRQRLLRYMERKERGSGRWQYMLQTLGLSPATWKEQITL